MVSVLLTCQDFEIKMPMSIDCPLAV